VPALPEPIALAVHFEDVDVMGEAVEERTGQALGAEHAGPLVDDQQLARGELALQPQEALLVTGFDQLVDEGGGGGEGDRKALLAGGKAQAQRDVGFAGAGRSSDIVPGIKKTKRSSAIAFIHAMANVLLLQAATGMAAKSF
jgi:hypothetical protein